MIAWYHRWAARCCVLHALRFERPEGVENESHWIGSYGEYVAASYLRAHGHRVLRQNFRRKGGGEIDLVTRQRDTLVFCEVKTRQSLAGGAPARAVDHEKRDLLRKAAHTWLLYLGADRETIPYRFDIIEVILSVGKPPHVRHLKDAFGSVEGRAHAWLR